MKHGIYLDYAAATPVGPEVKQAMEPYFSDSFYNPSATYLAGRQARQALESFRSQIAQLLGAKPSEIVFTAGATEANNLAVQGVMRQFPEGEVLVSAVEHESVLEPAKRFKHKEIPVDNNGIILLNKLSNLITSNTVLVSVMLVNNELGSIQPLRDVALILDKVRQDRLARQNRLPIYLHTDAAQAGNYFDLHTSRLGVDLLSINGGKIYGPKQSGVLFIKTGARLQPLMIGGGQEFGLRSGTENPAAAAGLAQALQIAQREHRAQAKRISGLRELFETEVLKKIPSAFINGSQHRAPHLISLTIPGTDNERLMMELDEAGIQCAAGSACSAGSDEVSHVLAAIGLDEKLARATLRFSLGRPTTRPDLQKTARELTRLSGSNR
jgi:cysteine desulfurase